MQTAVAYDFKGGLLAAERQLGVDYTQTLDWSGLSELEDVSDLEVAAGSMLESEVFRTEGTFDALGRPTTQTTPDGTVVRLAYNEAALLEGVSTNVRGAVSETAFVSNIDYDAKGRRTLIAYGNGTETSYAYDDITQRLTRLRTTDATRTFQDLAYTYDAVGNIVEIADAAQEDVYFNGTVVTATQRYEYDALYRLTNAEGREHAGQNAVQPTEFGASPSLHPQDGTAMRTYAEQYVYDVVGNILSMQHTAASGNWTRRYQYAANGNRLQANSAPGDAVGVYSHAYSYDAHGNMTAMPHLSAVTWNYADQMRSADLGGGGTAYFVYDASGQRVRKVRVNLSGTQTYERIYLGAYELYRERTSGALQLERETLHIADDGGRMCDLETRTVESGTPVLSPTTHHRYQYSNHLGSASLELTQTAEVISYEEYHPYGTSAYRAVNSSIDVSERRYRYTGKERDEETGLGYHGARYYACWLGRWTGSDPIGLGDGVNRYAYVSGRPLGRVDPSGLAATKTADDQQRAAVGEKPTEDFIRAVDAEVKSLDRVADRAEVWRRAREQLDGFDPTLSLLLPPDMTRPGPTELEVGSLGKERVFVDIRSSVKSRAGDRLRQRGDCDRRSGELVREREGKEIPVTIADSLARFSMISVDHDALFEATGGDVSKLRDALIADMSSQLADTLAHELFHVQRRLRELGVAPKSGVTFESSRQQGLDFVQEHTAAASAVRTANSKSPGDGRGTFLVEEAFASVSASRGVGRPVRSVDQFVQGYTAQSNNPTLARALNAQIRTIYETVRSEYETSLSDPFGLDLLKNLRLDF